MDRESGVLPREQQLDALLSDQLLVPERANHLVAKEQLCHFRIDTRQDLQLGSSVRNLVDR